MVFIRVHLSKSAADFSVAAIMNPQAGADKMKKIYMVIIAALVLSSVVQAQKKEQERLQHAGKVLQEILNIPDNLPRPVLDRADCVIVLPSVKKGALGIGASIGRGAMSCRGGANFTGAWGHPLCTPWKASASVSRSAVRPPILFCW